MKRYQDGNIFAYMDKVKCFHPYPQPHSVLMDIELGIFFVMRKVFKIFNSQGNPPFLGIHFLRYRDVQVLDTQQTDIITSMLSVLWIEQFIIRAIRFELMLWFKRSEMIRQRSPIIKRLLILIRLNELYTIRNE